MEETKIYNSNEFNDAFIKSTLKEVYEILESRGYNPINQIVGYLISGDPGYITSYNGARNLIVSVDRIKILEVLVQDLMNL